MKVIKNVLSVATVALAFAACNNVDFKKTSAGVPFKVMGKSKGDSIRLGNFVQVHITQELKGGGKDSLLGTSYTSGTPQILPIQAPTTKATYLDPGANLTEAIRHARKGDSVELVFSADSILRTVPKEMLSQVPFKKGQSVHFRAMIVNVFKTAEEAQAVAEKDRAAASQKQNAIDAKAIEQYLASKNISAPKTAQGVYVQTIQPGQGAKPDSGQYVKIKYRGTDLAGKKFDEGEFPMQIGMRGSVPGFEDGVRQFAKGGKGVIYIPSSLGYGPQGNPPVIQPNQILVFDIEILDISNQPIAQAPMPMPQGQQGHSKDDGHGH